jgi:muramoyltetrapeptide carboxypeptidase
MDRKHFLSAAGALVTGTLLPLQQAIAIERNAPGDTVFKKPPYLKAGDTIGITAPAGYITLERMLPAIKVLESWGYTIQIGSTIGKRDFTFGGTDEERTADLQQMLDNPGLKAILCARGGYGVVRIVDRLDWTQFKKNPKWLIGFSDITILHSHIHTHCKAASLHSKMTNSFPDDWSQAEPIQVQTIASIHEALGGKEMHYTALPQAQNKLGMAEGVLTGGNLKIIESMAGSASDIDTREKILFVEDTGEYLYSIDRMFWNLKRTGKLSHLKALIVGGFNIKPDDEGEEFGKTLQDIVLEKVKEYHYPVCFDFPVGHQRANFALKCGIKHQLKITVEEVLLTEMI